MGGGEGRVQRVTRVLPFHALSLANALYEVCVARDSGLPSPKICHCVAIRHKVSTTQTPTDQPRTQRAQPHALGEHERYKPVTLTPRPARGAPQARNPQGSGARGGRGGATKTNLNSHIKVRYGRLVPAGKANLGVADDVAARLALALAFERATAATSPPEKNPDAQAQQRRTRRHPADSTSSAMLRSGMGLRGSGCVALACGGACDASAVATPAPGN